MAVEGHSSSYRACHVSRSFDGAMVFLELKAKSANGYHGLLGRVQEGLGGLLSDRATQLHRLLKSLASALLVA
jgi:hypothetical protein